MLNLLFYLEVHQDITVSRKMTELPGYELLLLKRDIIGRRASIVQPTEFHAING